MHMCMKEGNKDKAGWGNYMLVLDNFLPNTRYIILENKMLGMGLAFFSTKLIILGMLAIDYTGLPCVLCSACLLHCWEKYVLPSPTGSA